MLDATPSLRDLDLIARSDRMSHKKPELPADLPVTLRTETLAKGGWVDRDFLLRLPSFGTNIKKEP